MIGLLLGLPMANLPDPYGWLLPIGTIVVTGLGMMGLTVAKRHDLLEALRSAGFFRPPDRRRRRRPTRGPDRLRRHQRADRRPDHRRRRLGLPAGTLVVPRFVVAELQHIADQPRPDPPRPRAARPGDPVASLQKDPRVAVELNDEDVPDVERGRRQARSSWRGNAAPAILTNDFNLNRVAQLDDVRVLNLNHLANALKPAFLPGDALQVKVIQQGKEPGQGLAYLDDGTMIVVEGGGEMIEREVEVTVVRVLQTVAGRMVFAQPRADGSPARAHVGRRA